MVEDPQACVGFLLISGLLLLTKKIHINRIFITYYIVYYILEFNTLYIPELKSFLVIHLYASVNIEIIMLHPKETK